MSLTDKQLKARQKGIGGSDAGAILGVSPWATPLDVYLSKTGDAEPREPSDAMDWGNRLEAVVADAAAQRLGVRVRRNNRTLQHREHAFMLGNLDREVVGQRAILEVKTAGHKSDEYGEEGTDQIPAVYVAQCAHYLAVRNYEVAYVPVLFMRERRLAIYQVNRDPELERMLVEAERHFWHEHVEARVPPDPRTLEDIRNRWPRDDAGALTATAEVLAACELLNEVKAEAKSLGKQRDDLEATIKRYMAEHGELLAPSGDTLATWRVQKARRLDAKALEAAHPDIAAGFRRETTSRVFRLK